LAQRAENHVAELLSDLFAVLLPAFMEPEGDTGQHAKDSTYRYVCVFHLEQTRVLACFDYLAQAVAIVFQQLLDLLAMGLLQAAQLKVGQQRIRALVDLELDMSADKDFQSRYAIVRSPKSVPDSVKQLFQVILQQFEEQGVLAFQVGIQRSGMYAYAIAYMSQADVCIAFAGKHIQGHVPYLLAPINLFDGQGG
jgi:hypothetical protein